jgi:hypothetical protein
MQHRPFVDEFDNLDRVAKASVDVVIVGENPRATQEDASRALLPPGSLISYAMPEGGFMLRLFAFTERPDQPLDVIATRAGIRHTMAVTREVRGEAGGDYGYLIPILFSVELAGGTDLEIAVPDGAAVQLSRLELHRKP